MSKKILIEKFKKYLKQSMNYFPPNSSYSVISHFEDITLQAFENSIEKYNDITFSEEQENLLLEKLAHWTVLAYLNSSELNLEEHYCEKMLSKILHSIIENYSACIKKGRDTNTTNNIIDEIAKDIFKTTVDSYLSKGIINKQQAHKSKIEFTNKYVDNVEENIKNNKTLYKLAIGMGIIIIGIPTIISILTQISFLKALIATITITVICYWIYMFFYNWRVNQELKELWTLKAGKAGGNGYSNENGSSNKTTGAKQNTDNSSKSPTFTKALQTSIEVYVGKNLESFAEGYFEGQLPVLIAKLRNKLIREVSYSLPPVAMIPSSLIEANEYLIKFKKQEVARGKVDFHSQTKYEYPIELIVEHLEISIKKHLKDLK